MQRSPSGFNFTPYKVVLVQDAGTKQRLADAMSGGNGPRVLQAPITAVFAADLRPFASIDRVVRLERDAGKSSRYLKNLEFDAAAMLAGCGPPVVHSARSALFKAVSRVVPLPSLNSSEAWAFKNTMLAAQSFMLAASAHGLSTHPMEGFNAEGVRRTCGISSQYGIPVVISLGYPAALVEGSEGGRGQLSPRPAPRDVFSWDTLDRPVEGIVELK